MERTQHGRLADLAAEDAASCASPSCGTRCETAEPPELAAELAASDDPARRLAEPERALRVLWLLKDADALDRVRLGFGECAGPAAAAPRGDDRAHPVRRRAVRRTGLTGGALPARPSHAADASPAARATAGNVHPRHPRCARIGLLASVAGRAQHPGPAGPPMSRRHRQPIRPGSRRRPSGRGATGPRLLFFDVPRPPRPRAASGGGRAGRPLRRAALVDRGPRRAAPLPARRRPAGRPLALERHRRRARGAGRRRPAGLRPPAGRPRAAVLPRLLVRRRGARAAQPRRRRGGRAGPRGHRPPAGRGDPRPGRSRRPRRRPPPLRRRPLARRPSPAAPRPASRGRSGPDAARLDDAQRAAVEHARGPARVLAPAGSGKTKTLVSRVVELVDRGADPSGILMLAFNRKAAEQLEERLAALGIATTRRLGSPPDDRAPAGGGTPSASLGIRAAPPTRVRPASTAPPSTPSATGTSARSCGRASRSTTTAARCARSWPGPWRPPASRSRELKPRRGSDPVGAFMNGLTRVRAALEPVDGVEVQVECVTETPIVTIPFAATHAQYARAQAATGLQSFDDQIYFAVADMLADPAHRAFIQGRFDHVLVDEFQDLNGAQLALVDLLSRPHRRAVRRRRRRPAHLRLAAGRPARHPRVPPAHAAQAVVGHLHAVHQLPLLACGRGDRRAPRRQQRGARGQGHPAARRGAGRRGAASSARRPGRSAPARSAPSCAPRRRGSPATGATWPCSAATARSSCWSRSRWTPATCRGRRRSAARCSRTRRRRLLRAYLGLVRAPDELPAAGLAGRAQPAEPLRERRRRRGRRRGHAAVGAPAGGRGQGASGRAAPSLRSRRARVDG